MRISFYTLGCKVNQFETHLLSDRFLHKGFEVVEFGQEADVYIVNTCCVTAKAAYQARQVLRRIRREQPNAKIVATGCYAQVYPNEIFDSLEGQVCIVGNDQKHRIPEMAESQEDCVRICVGDITKVQDVPQHLLSKPHGRTRAFMRIQDGCNAFCSYCIVPYARGRSRSLPPKLVKKQISIFKEHGVKEIVITGINLASWGKDLPTRTSFRHLMEDILPSFPNIRFRISSQEPTEIGIEMLKFLSAAPNFCHHFHVPLQSGSKTILKKMNRKYTPEQFAVVIEKIKSYLPDAAIGIDVMAGFPGETRSEFDKTLTFLESIPLTYIHAFPYSPRPGTLAFGWKNDCSKQEKNRRVKELIELGRGKKEEFYKRAVGMEAELLIEQKDKESGLWKGLTSNYISVRLSEPIIDKDMANKLVKVKLLRSETTEFLYGKII